MTQFGTNRIACRQIRAFRKLEKVRPGRKHIVPYGHYRAHGFVSAASAAFPESSRFAGHPLP
jgi:hypothetical protein